MNRKIWLGVLFLTCVLFLFSCNKIDKKTEVLKPSSVIIESENIIDKDIKWNEAFVVITGNSAKYEKKLNKKDGHILTFEENIKEGLYTVEIKAIDTENKIIENNVSRAKNIFSAKAENVKIRNGENKIKIPYILEKSRIYFSSDISTFRNIKKMYAYIKYEGKDAEEKTEIKNIKEILKINPGKIYIRVEALNDKDEIIKSLMPFVFNIEPDDEKEVKIEIKENKSGIEIKLPYISEVKEVTGSFNIDTDSVAINWKYDIPYTKFRVYKKTSLNNYPVFFKETLKNEVVDETPENEEIEYYINAVNGEKSSGLVMKKISALRTTTLPAVKNLSAAADETNLKITWKYDISDAKFVIECKKGNEETFTKIGETTEKTFDYNMSEKNQYEFSVVAVIGEKKSIQKKTGYTFGYSLDKTGPEYTGSVLLISNESVFGNRSYNTGTISSGIKESIPEGLGKGAYKMDANRPLNPELKRDRVYEGQAGKEPAEYKIGDKKSYKVFNFVNEAIDALEATLQYSGEKCEVWVENPREIKESDAQLIGQEFDNKIYKLVTENFAYPSDVDKNGKVVILCYDIKDGFSGYNGYIGGYFYSGDLFNQDDSNKMEIFYIDTYPLMHNPKSAPLEFKECYSTLVHEFQHMVNFNKNYLLEKIDDPGTIEMDTWLNEGLSMAAEHMYNGVLKDRINYYNRASSIQNGHSLLYWDEKGDVLCNYSLSYLFVQYLKEQCSQGDAIFKEIINLKENDYMAVQNLIQKYIKPELTFKDFMTSFRLALLLKDKTNLYGFKGNKDFDGLTPKYAPNDIKSIRGGGAYYKTITGSVKPQNSDPVIKFVGIKW